MKKLLAFSIISISLIPVLTLAFTPGKIPTGGELGIQEINSIKEPNDLLDLVGSVVGYVYAVFFVIAVLFILFAAFNYLTGANAPDKVKAAHTQLVYAAIAIAIALLAVTAQVIIGNFLKGNSGSGNQQNTESGGTPWIPSPNFPGGPVST